MHPQLQATFSPERILILDPSQTADRRFLQVVEDVNGKKRELDDEKTALPSLKLFQEVQGTTQEASASIGFTIASIDTLKPAVLSMTGQHHTALCERLAASYKKPQLQKYLELHMESPKGIKSRTKWQLAEMIVDKVWGILQSETADLSAVVRRKSLELDKLQIFLLAVSNARLLRHLGAAGAKIELSSHEVVFKGTESQVSNAENLLLLALGRSYKDTVDFTALRNMYEDANCDFDAALASVSESLAIYFEEKANCMYEVAALDALQVQRSQRLLLSMVLNRGEQRYELENERENENQPKEHSASDDSVSVIPFVDESSLPFHARQPYYVLRKPVKRRFVADALKHLEVEETPSLDYQQQVLEAKTAPQPHKRDLEQESWSLLRDLGIVNEPDVEQDAIQKDTTADTEISSDSNIAADTETDPKITQWSAEVANKHYGFLTTFAPSELPTSTMFTVSLGSILFPAPEGSSTIQGFGSLSQLGNPSRFHSHAALAVHELMKCQLFLQSEASASVESMVHDPHTYVAQIQLVPSPFDNADHQKYPPVEMWVELNERFRADIDTLSMVLVQGENHSMIGLPQEVLDINISCQSTSNLLDAGPSRSERGNTIEEILAETTSRYSRFDAQPGLSEFLDGSKLDFSGNTAPSIHPHIDLRIGNKTVRYLYVKVNHRKQLEFRYNNSLVQLSTVDGGNMGGRTTEITFVGDDTKEGLQHLIADSRKFLEQCK